MAVLVTLIYLAFQTRQNTLAISAQLDAAAIGTTQNAILLAATSSELVEAMQEESTGDITTNEVRLGSYWASLIFFSQWQHQQARRGLLPTYDEAGAARTVRNFFTNTHSFEGVWEGGKPSFPPEFVEWVEEQRSKAA